MTAPYGGYQVTAGIFNLADEAGAAQVGGQVGALVETGGGSFAAMAAGSGPARIRRPRPVQVGWHDRGHYLVYCVITRPDGQPVAADDPYAAAITTDLLEHLPGRGDARRPRLAYESPIALARVDGLRRVGAGWRRRGRRTRSRPDSRPRPASARAPAPR